MVSASQMWIFLVLCDIFRLLTMEFVYVRVVMATKIKTAETKSYKIHKQTSHGARKPVRHLKRGRFGSDRQSYTMYPSVVFAAALLMKSSSLPLGAADAPWLKTRRVSSKAWWWKLLVYKKKKKKELDERMERYHWLGMSEGKQAIGLRLQRRCSVVGCCHGAEKSHQREEELVCVCVWAEVKVSTVGFNLVRAGCESRPAASTWVWMKGLWVMTGSANTLMLVYRYKPMHTYWHSYCI